MKDNTWKTIAIIFIGLFILETSILIWAYNYGMNEENERLSCIYDVCESADGGTYDSFKYDTEINMCYCFKGNKMIKQEYIK